MIEKTHEISKRWKNLVSQVAVILALFILAGCATGANYGKLERNRDLDNMFLRYEVLPDHRYYSTGGFDAPDAILAVHTDYELDNSVNLWRGIPNVDYGQMRKWIDTIAPEQNYRHSNAYFAAYILNPTGKRVGAWYSIEPQTTVKFLEGNKIQVRTPNRSLDFGIGIRRGGL
ncbi:MAG: hypothetical protein OEL85_05980 [Desulfobulbaceae bacterium]|nr:hypothetical protein [Desulfobulbaceae bacterium]